MNFSHFPVFGNIRSLFKKASKRKLVLYHRGYLYVDRMNSEDLDFGASYIYRKAKAGECILVQKRQGEFDYCYYFAKT